MVIMALDHTRDFFHSTAWTEDPLNLATTTPILFVTRWITNFCAPVFVFLAGTSIYLQSLRKTKQELSSFLIKRGLWLIFAELVIVNLGMTFNPLYTIQILQVIWVIGISMVILGLLIHLPFRLILILGLVIVLGHNLLDVVEAAPGFKPSLWWDLLHRRGIYPYANGHFLFVLYPILPWLGLMLLGYCTGTFFAPTVSPATRKTALLLTGFGLLVFFIVLRFSNLYGNPTPWSEQKSGLLTVFSFIDVNKYPPSLLYMCITIGPALLFLVAIESVKNRLTNFLRTFGRTAFFYYIVHWYVLHSLCLLMFLSRGHLLSDGVNIATKTQTILLFVVPGEGVGLPVVYVIWAGTVLVLYPLCRWYDRYKTSHKEKWWLSYL
ncbi:DUF1624 domain-containing protein [Cytophagaceae bacterium SJW1-29]|uniref:DUF1624 domain-containing protein n=2 Tax=Salmonirosea aquatica TaxID=2654236 RepID=A0A7C9F4S1_9BACT|nr:DUF1624 domain-containing protein [Cytophagaceae bacterium SJW1-29]